MEWHSLEKNMLTNFKELISNEIIIYPQEITRIILLSKLDYQLTQLVNKLAEEINSNLVAFKELPY